MRILREAEGMRERGHEVTFAVMKGGKLVDAACKAGFTVAEFNFHKGGWLRCLFGLMALMRRHKIDLVNTHSSLDSWIGGLAARMAGRPIVRTRHLSTPIKAGLNSRVLYGKLADFVVSTCSSILPMISEQSKKPMNLCRSIPTGVDPRRIFEDGEGGKSFRREMGFAETDFLVGTACFMRSWKGIDDFLRAADHLRKEKQIKWLCIGGGHVEKYHLLAKELKLEGIVYFTGHLENPFPAMNALDVFALLSTAHEGVSQAILQAAYLKKPLIATPIGGSSEVCIDRVTGIQVPTHSPTQVAAAVLELKDQILGAREMGERGRKLVLEKFTLSQTIDQMEEVYSKVLGGP
jgi:glycosyltransferase involved in cell wall biosynthesis